MTTKKKKKKAVTKATRSLKFQKIKTDVISVFIYLPNILIILTAIKNKNMENKNGEMFFDDCPICRAMKAAQERGRELSLEELKEAFQEAKDQGGVVGGEWFEK